MRIITRKQAQKEGLKYYYNGKPCKNGHISNRFVSTRHCLACREVYNEVNREKIQAQQKSYTKANKAKKKEYDKKYLKENSKRKNAYFSKYRADKLKATPKWADLEKIKEIYLKCPKGYQVDHIVPLRGKLVSGLHVHYNLQYLTKEENNRKNNKW